MQGRRRWCLRTHLLIRNTHVVADVSEDCGLHEEALAVWLSASCNHLCAFLLARFDQVEDLRALLLVDLPRKQV